VDEAARNDVEEVARNDADEADRDGMAEEAGNDRVVSRHPERQRGISAIEAAGILHPAREGFRMTSTRRTR
jgi:hypothetical protein